MLWKSASAFFSARQLVSARNSHSSDVRGLVVRCLPFNPEGSGSNPCVCANFFLQIFRSRRFSLFRHCETPLFRLCETFFRKFLNVPKGSSFIFFSIFCNRINVKTLKGPFFQIFRHYETVKNSQFLFSKSFQSLQGYHSIFLKFCNRMDVKKSQRASLYSFRHCEIFRNE